MDPAYSFDLTMVTDDCGNEYPPGSNTYAWGFEVCLWHHARRRHIEPLFDDDAQREAWEEHLRHQQLPPRPRAVPTATVVDLMGLVVTGVRPALNAAYHARAEMIGVSLKSVSNKLDNLEPDISAAFVRTTAQRLEAVVPLPGDHVKILDGNPSPFGPPGSLCTCPI